MTYVTCGHCRCIRPLLEVHISRNGNSFECLDCEKEYDAEVAEKAWNNWAAVKWMLVLYVVIVVVGIWR